MAPFDDVTSWTSQRVSKVADAQAVGYTDAALDGRYLYLSTSGFGHMARYDTGASGKVPAWFHGSAR